MVADKEFVLNGFLFSPSFEPYWRWYGQIIWGGLSWFIFVIWSAKYQYSTFAANILQISFIYLLVCVFFFLRCLFMTTVSSLVIGLCFQMRNIANY